MKRIFLMALVIAAITPAVARAEMRKWTEAASGRELEAELLSVDGEMVELRRSSDGRRFKLSLAKLSEADRIFVEKFASGAGGGMPSAKADRWKDLEWKSAEEIPMAGETHARFEKLDKAIAAFMVEKGIGAAVAAVSRKGKVVYDRAFGFQDANLKTPLRVGTSMRLASISKTITAAAAKTLLRDGKMKESDTIWELLELESTAPSDLDARWKVVTVGHLLKHEGGWDRDAVGDVMFMAEKMADEMGVKLDELTFDNVLEWMLKRPLDFDPGTKESYSNFGYNLLAHTCEKVSGKPWEEYLKESIAKEAGMTALVVSPTEVENRVPGETWYHYHPEYEKEPRVMPFRTEIQLGAGSLSCSAGNLCRFLEAYWISGEPRKGDGYKYNFFGSMPGTTSVSGQRLDGVNFAVITNRRDKATSNWNEELKEAVAKVLDEVNW